MIIRNKFNGYIGGNSRLYPGGGGGPITGGTLQITTGASLGSNVGALVGGAALGILSAVATYFVGGEYQQTISVGLLMIVLLVKPAGLFGSQSVRPV